MAEENQLEEEKEIDETGTPRPIDGNRVKKSIVKEDVDIFDEVFEGKTKKHSKEKKTKNKIKKKKKTEEKELEEKEKKENELEDKKEDLEKENKKTEKTETKKNSKAKNSEKEEKRRTVDSAETEEKKEKKKKTKKASKKKKDVYEKKELTEREKNLLEETKGDELEEELPEKPEIKKRIIENAKMISEDEFDDFDTDDIEGIEYYSGEKTFSLADEKKGQETKAKGTAIELEFLENQETGNAFIGRKKSVFEKHKEKAGLFIGKVSEETEENKSILLDSLNPHVVFVCGARGSGKSYVLGVLAEELALKNKDVGMVVIDPIGVFWSMRFPNKEINEVAKLSEWDLMPQGLEGMKVFIPEGIKSEVPKSTYDATFSIQPSLLTAEDWCLTFGMERFGPSGLLLSKVLKKLEHGFKAEGKYIKAKKLNYSLNDLIYCLEKDEELNSRDRGYKQDSIRALVSRLEAAKSWGIFSEKGTPLGELSREGQLTILDTSFLEDDVTALIIGIIARRLLAARKISTRKEAAKKFKHNLDEMLEMDIPPTWLFIDEAHTLIPSGNVRTPATAALVEYVKQGRRPGCSLVFATQQPSAIDTKVLSQLDILISHKLVFDDDIKAIFKRIPSVVPLRFKKSSFIRTLSVGTALVADRREETSRAFIMNIRPRMSQHEGRDAETSEAKEDVSENQVKELATEMIWRKLQQEQLEMEKINILVDTLNGKYKSKIMLSTVLDALEEKGAIIEPERAFIKGKETKTEEPEEEIETEEERYEKEVEEGLKKQELEKTTGFKKLETEKSSIKELSISLKIDETSARKIANKKRKKKTLGFIGSEEIIKGIVLNFEPLYKISVNDFDLKKEFVSVDAYVNALTGELIHFDGKKFIESKGFNKSSSLNKDESIILRNLLQKKNLKEIIEVNFDISEDKAKRIISNLAEKGFVKKDKKEGKIQYSLNSELDLPFSPRHKIISSINNCSFNENTLNNIVKEKFSFEEVSLMVKGFWPNSIVKKTVKVYRPVYYVSLEDDGKERILKIDGITGQTI